MYEGSFPASERDMCPPRGGGCGREEEGHEDPIKKNFSII